MKKMVAMAIYNATCIPLFQDLCKICTIVTI